MESESLKLSPCKGCERRQVGCHGECEDYQIFRADIQKNKKKRDLAYSFTRKMYARKKMIKRKEDARKEW